MAATDDLIVKNGAKFVQEGDALPALGGATVSALMDSPLYLANSGDVYWGTLLNGAESTEDRAWMRNDEVIVRKGHTVIEGNLAGQLPLVPNAFHVSPDGRYWLGQVQLQGTGEAAVLADFGLAVPFPGRGQNEGTLTLAAGNVIVGEAITLQMDGGQASGVVPVLLLSSQAAIPGSSLGLPTPFGELLVGPVSLVVPGSVWNGSPVDLDFTLPNKLALVDSTWYGQGIFIDPSAVHPGRLTGGLRFEIGAP